MVILRSGRDTTADSTSIAQTPDNSSSFPFLRLPLELGENIYRKLLTTRYAFVEPKLSDDSNYPGRYNLSPSILLANNQIYLEAKRVLYMKNDFAIFRIYGSTIERSAWIKYVPVFKRLSEEKIPNPKLRIIIEPITEEAKTTNGWFTMITTAEGVPPCFVGKCLAFSLLPTDEPCLGRS
jgi:hypothetical protein